MRLAVRLIKRALDLRDLTLENLMLTVTLDVLGP